MTTCMQCAILESMELCNTDSLIVAVMAAQHIMKNAVNRIMLMIGLPSA